MSLPKAYQNYKRTTVETASPGQLVVMLYDGAARFLDQAKVELDEKRPKEAHLFLIKAQKILSELMSSLDMEQGGEIAENLLALYEFMFMRLVDANMRKDSAPVVEVMELMLSLRGAWGEAAATDAVERRKGNGDDPKPSTPGGGFSVVS